MENPGTREAARLTGCKNFSRLKRTDDHHGEALDWGVSLHVSKVIPEDAEWIGYRAHDFIPVWGAQDETENRMKADIADQAELPFERNYYLRGRDGQKDAVCWFVQRENIGILEEKGMPDYLELKEEKMLFLK